MLPQFIVRHPHTNVDLCLKRGQRLLVVGEGLRERHGLRVHTVDPYVLPRVLAHYDSVRKAPGKWGRPDVPTCMLIADEVLETIPGMMRWVMQQLARPNPQFDALAQHLRRTECYQLVRYILDQGAGQSIADMARQYGLSDVHFYRQSKKFFGQPLKRQLRAQRAAGALLECSGRERSFTEIAIGHGYSSASHFCAEIKALLGRSPSALYQITRGY